MAATPKFWTGTWTWPRTLLLAGIVYVVAVVLLIAAARSDSGRWLVLAVVGLAVAFLIVHRLLQHLPTIAWHLVVALTAMLVGVVLFATWGATGRLPGLGFAGLSTLFLGLGELLSALRTRAGAHDGRLRVGGAALLVLCGAAVVFGVVRFAQGSAAGIGVTIAALLVVPIALGLFTEGVVRSDRWSDHRLTGRWATAGLVGAGLILMGAGGIRLANLELATSAVWALAIGGFLLVGAISSNTVTDIVAVATLGLLFLANAPKEAPLESPVLLTPDTRDVVVAIGDSYMSGEGAKSFFVDTNTPGVNACRRAPTAYPAQLHFDGPSANTKVVFLACSGAVANQLWADNQEPKEPMDWETTAGEGPSSELLTGLPQLGSFERRVSTAPGDPALPLDPQLVLVGIAGNDADFGGLVTTCLAPGDCSELGSTYLDHLTDVAASLDVAFTRISATFGDTPVLVVPYPVPLRETGCPSSLFTEDEHRFINGFTRELDGVQRRAAAKAGFGFLADVADLFAVQHLRLCDAPTDQLGVNTIAKETVNGSIEQTVDVNNWFHNSMHPNARGHAAVAATVDQWMRDHPDLRATDEDEHTEADWVAAHPDVRGMDAIMGEQAWTPCELPPELADDATAAAKAERAEYCDPGPWILRQARSAVLPGLPPLGAMLVGAWLIWLRLIVWWRGGRTEVDDMLEQVPFHGRATRTRAIVLGVAAVLTVVALWQLNQASGPLREMGTSYNAVQLAGKDLGADPAVCCPDPSGVLTATVRWDLLFAASYGTAGFLLGGLLAQAARRCRWRRPPDHASRPDRLADLYAVAGWTIALAAILDEAENVILLLAARGWTEGGVWVARIGGVKWTLVALAVALAVIASVAIALARLAPAPPRPVAEPAPIAPGTTGLAPRAS